MQRSTTTTSSSTDFVVTHPLDPEDAPTVAAMRAMTSSTKGMLRGIAAREPFDALMESVSPRDDVTFKFDTISGVPGLWVHPAKNRYDEAMLHLHGGWFNLGTAKAYRHLVAHIAARIGAKAFVPDYQLAPEHPFPAAVDDVLSCYRGLDEMGIRRIAVTGDSAGGNLALVLASRVTDEIISTKMTFVGAAALSPVTDLTLSGTTYETRAGADPYFTRPQVAELVGAYLGSADPKDPRASPIYGRLSGLPPVRIHVGDDEVLLDDSRRYIERAVAAGVDARLDVWLGMAHGFPASVGKLKTSAEALDAIGVFLTEKLHSASTPFGRRPPDGVSRGGRSRS
jgi:epsilon-lactone hydrolase